MLETWKLVNSCCESPCLRDVKKLVSYADSEHENEWYRAYRESSRRSDGVGRSRSVICGQEMGFGEDGNKLGPFFGEWGYVAWFGERQDRTKGCDTC
ncbi:hypothetical protein Zmor_005434 [Zophobas morio]|uniref:Uncharacterized protein n=1 Tax=Zophobas morio TaxID=2755281 RepID=A0AA38MMH5_9CUCU|nr:hypothetical protein Zmor_005434 [Zophobas morio]